MTRPSRRTIAATGACIVLAGWLLLATVAVIL